MKQSTRAELMNMLYALWTSGTISYSTFLELKSVKSSVNLQKMIDEIIDDNK